MLLLGTRIQRQRRDYRPRQFHGIEWNSWQAVDLAFWWPLYGRGDYADQVRRAVVSDVIAGTAPTTGLTETMGPSYEHGDPDTYLLHEGIGDITGLPLTLMSLARPNTLEDSTGTTFLTLTSSNNHYIGLELRATNNVSRAIHRAGVSFTPADAPGLSVAGRWQHQVGVFASTTLRAIYHDGRFGADETSTIDWPAPDRISLGANARSTVTSISNGFMGDCRIYTKAWTADEIAELYDADRWGLYWQPSTRVYVSLGAAAVGQTPLGARYRFRYRFG